MLFLCFFVVSNSLRCPFSQQRTMSRVQQNGNMQGCVVAPSTVEVAPPPNVGATNGSGGQVLQDPSQYVAYVHVAQKSTSQL